MADSDILLLAFLAFAVLAMVGFRSAIWKLIQALADELNNGGGPTPMHPIPVNDALLLRRRLPR